MNLQGKKGSMARKRKVGRNESVIEEIEETEKGYDPKSDPTVEKTEKGNDLKSDPTVEKTEDENGAKFNPTIEKTEDENGPKSGPKQDPGHPPTSPSVWRSRSEGFMTKVPKIYCLKKRSWKGRNSRRKLNSPTVDLKNESEQEGHTPSVHVLDQPDKWCIYRVPSKLRNVNEAAYTPQLVSIGPFHHGKLELKDMEGHKNIYCDNFCARCWKSKDELKHFIKGRLENILRCYAGTIELDIHIDPLDIIVVDACFIIELFLVNSKTEKHENDYILRSPWLRKAIEQDLMLFENQLPYSLLQELYDFATPLPSSIHPSRLSSTNHEDSQDHFIDMPNSKAEPFYDHPFYKLTCHFFTNYRKEKSDENRVKPKHFTDLVRHFLCPDSPKKEMIWKDNNIISIYDVKQLRAAGVKFRPLKKDHEGFVIKVDDNKLTLACFRNMYLRLTQFCVKDETECIIRNVMALEQFLYPDKAYICNYFLLLDELVDTVEDVNFLVESKVIINMLGSNKAVSKLINSLCEQIMEEKSCYVDVCEQLNKHYENFWNRHVATLRQVYFKDLWTGSATIVGLCVLVISVTISIRTIISGRKLCVHK